MFSKPLPKLPEPSLPGSGSTGAQRELSNTKRIHHEPTECRAFRKCFSVLAEGITDPGKLAIQLYSGDLIGRDIRREAQKPAIAEGVKVVTLLSAVEDQIVASPATKFREFLGVLQGEPSLQHLAKKLEDTHCELSGQCTASVPPSTSTPSSPPLATNTFSQQHLPPVAKRPRTEFDVLQPQYFSKHTEQSSDFQVHQTSMHYPQAHADGQSSAVHTYASYLKDVYTRQKLPMYDKWPQVKSKKFINLALITREDITKHEADQFTKATIHGNVDDIKKSKRAMDIGEIAQLPDGAEPKCILIEGAPGVGKSSLAWKLCRKWGKGMLLKQYRLVVLLRLRDTHVRGAMNISDLFRYHDHQIQQAAVDEIQRTGGKGVLLLFEGYDELPDDLRTKNSVFLDVITGRELPEAAVLITSRPWASEFLHWHCKRHISQYIEILGFTKEDIQSYLESATADDPSLLTGLKKYISCYPHINSLMYIPLNSVIVVEVYQNSRKGETLVPKTMTELYSSLVRSLLLRHLFDHPEHSQKRWRVRSFKDLPQDVYKQLCELGRIAYEGILHDQQVIFSDLPDDFETLGLMQCVPELYLDEGAATSYNFLHLTVQEYLAAFHLSQQPVEKQIEHFKKYHAVTKRSHHQFQMVLRFLSGIRKFSEYPIEVVDVLSEVIKSPGVRSWVHVSFTMLHWLFEAQDHDVIAKLLGPSKVQFDMQYAYYRDNYYGNTSYVVTPFDCFALGYCVSHSKCIWSICLGHWCPNHTGCHIGDEGLEMLVHGAVEEETHCTGGISFLDLSENNITSEGLNHLLNFPKQLINKLEVLYLDNWFSLFYISDHINRLNSESCAILTHLIPHVPHLKELYLSDNPAIGQGGAVSLITTLTTLNSLEKLSLHNTGTGVKDCQALSKLLSSSTSLKKLSISFNDLPPDTVELIFSGLHHNTTLESLDISDSNISLKLIFSMLRLNRTLIYLNLSTCHIDSDGAEELASALCTNNTLQELNLARNPIGIKGATALAKMLLKNKSLKALNICCIGKVGTQKVVDSLTHNKTLETLRVTSQVCCEVDNHERIILFDSYF